MFKVNYAMLNISIKLPLVLIYHLEYRKTLSITFCIECTSTAGISATQPKMCPLSFYLKVPVPVRTYGNGIIYLEKVESKAIAFVEVSGNPDCPTGPVNIRTA